MRETQPLMQDESALYSAWLRYPRLADTTISSRYREVLSLVVVEGRDLESRTAVLELKNGAFRMLGIHPTISSVKPSHGSYTEIRVADESCADAEGILPDGFRITVVGDGEGRQLRIVGRSGVGCLYGVFWVLAHMRRAKPLDQAVGLENPANRIRMLNHWDNLDGSIERGYAGRSLFFRDGRVAYSERRIRDYARLLASIGINALSFNNVNVGDHEAALITPRHLESIGELAGLLRPYGIRPFLSVSFASPIIVGGLSTADPLDPAVRRWWRDAASAIYRVIPEFGGFVVKADSEYRPGPFTYGRTHVEGANMLAEALSPFGGTVFWRCFVYQVDRDWRDRRSDRAREAYDHYRPLDGQFWDNVVLQVKNGPMDFQVREPVSPLLGAMSRTNLALELQITQEYTGQQRDLCYLIPQWKDVLGFDTFAPEPGSTVARVVSGEVWGRARGGMVGVANVGDDPDWTGHPLAQANLYGFGRLAWNPVLTAEAITSEWVEQTLGTNRELDEAVGRMLLSSWHTYEQYTAPLGVGWMVNPGHHYGPSVDGYEYSHWGTYHYADHSGLGVDRTRSTGTGFTGQYGEPWSSRYESLEECPDELLLFFHHVPYTHRLHSGKTVIQHIYDSHFDGVDTVRGWIDQWRALEPWIERTYWERVLRRLEAQLANAEEWRDQVTTYFWRKSGIADQHQRVVP